MRWIAVCAAALLSMSGPVVAVPDGSDGSQKAAAVLARTKATQATYAAYFWNRITLPGQAEQEEWSAEFHQGDFHRVETPHDRMVADCRDGTGWAVSLLTGAFTHGPQVAAAACGIATNAMIAELVFLGPAQSPFGPAEQIRVVDQDYVREYDVSADGILLATTYARNDADRRPVIATRAFRVDRTLSNVAGPAGDMFDPATLDRSFVAEAFRRKPQS